MWPGGGGATVRGVGGGAGMTVRRWDRDRRTAETFEVPEMALSRWFTIGLDVYCSALFGFQKRSGARQ